jgi:AcrR family transcriptional regulator
VPRLIDTQTRTGTLVAATVSLLASQGVAGLSLRSLARESRISTGSLLHHFESRERIFSVAAHRTGSALLDGIRSDVIHDGVAAFLPGDDEGVLLTRAWLAWLELARGDEGLARIVGEARWREQGLLAQTHEHRLSRPDLDLLVATVDGLRVAVCAPARPMPPARARELLSEASHAALARSD